MGGKSVLPTPPRLLTRGTATDADTFPITFYGTRRPPCKAVEEFAERRAAESKAEGIVVGEARGKREGKRETMLSTAKRLLANGKLVLKEIAECTGLSLAQVKKLQAEMA